MSYCAARRHISEDCYQLALRIDCTAESLMQCPWGHGTYYEGPEPIEEAYKLARSLFRDGKLVLDRDQTLSDFMEILEMVYRDNAYMDSCAVCDSLAGPDQ